MISSSERKSIFWYIGAVFWNFNERRLRAAWRLVGILLLTAFLTIIIGMPFFAAGGSGPAGTTEKIVLYIAVLIAVTIATRLLDRRRFSDTGIFSKRDWWIDLGLGLLLGAGLMTFVFLVELAAGWITISETFYRANLNQPFWVGMLLALLLAVIVGVAEELLFRGYLLLNLAEGFNLRLLGPEWALVLAWLLSSAVFGFAHIINPNASAVSALTITLYGMWLGMGYVLTGSLAIPIGIHIAWNFFQGSVFGFPVSGGSDFTTMFIAIEQGGPKLWTGGNFGPEAGLLGLIALLLGVLCVTAWVRFRDQRLALYKTIPEPPMRD